MAAKPIDGTFEIRIEKRTASDVGPSRRQKGSWQMQVWKGLSGLSTAWLGETVGGPQLRQFIFPWTLLVRAGPRPGLQAVVPGILRHIKTLSQWKRQQAWKRRRPDKILHCYDPFTYEWDSAWTPQKIIENGKFSVLRGKSRHVTSACRPRGMCQSLWIKFCQYFFEYFLGFFSFHLTNNIIYIIFLFSHQLTTLFFSLNPGRAQRVLPCWNEKVALLQLRSESFHKRLHRPYKKGARVRLSVKASVFDGLLGSNHIKYLRSCLYQVTALVKFLSSNNIQQMWLYLVVNIVIQ